MVFVILLSIFVLTPAPIRAQFCHSRSLPHVLMHEYLRENDKSREFCCTVAMFSKNAWRNNVHV